MSLCSVVGVVLVACLSLVAAIDGLQPKDSTSTNRRCAGRRTVRSADAEYQFAVVIDAGSSGSRVRVYRWPDDSGRRTLMAGVRSIKPTLKIRIGLAQVADNETQVRDHIERLIRNASGHVPPADRELTPIYFMATAGQ